MLSDEKTPKETLEIDAHIRNECDAASEECSRLYRAVDLSSVAVVPIDSLLLGESPRQNGEDTAHTQVLANVESRFPPIIVHRHTMRVIDGMHRLKAAMMRGDDTIEVHFFDGSEDLAFLLAVKENIAHGLPLSLADREAAAARVIASQPQWSDRAIAAATGLGAKTVGQIRRRTTEHSPQLNTRIGRDGRERPLDGAPGRLLASKIIETQPNVSLRLIAQKAGVSVATARDVRERIRQGRDPLPPRQRAAQRDAESVTVPLSMPRTAPPHPGTGEPISWAAIRLKLGKDPTVRYAESGRSFLRWFDAHVIESSEYREVAKSVPAHWANDIAALARHCAQKWLDIARSLEHDGQATA